jgi:3-(3-hydroxy-phenyl)propionate hydroxylase
MNEARVLIAGAGPVGLTAAAHLVAQGVPVTVLEAGLALSGESRASTFHPSTLDLLEPLGVLPQMLTMGLKAPKLQYRSRAEGVIAQFDFAAIADETLHPYRLQLEQFRLTELLLESLLGRPGFRIEFGVEVDGVTQDSAGVQAHARRNGAAETFAGRWLIGADGARSAVRRALAVEFEGFTWPERFLVLSTPFDFKSVLPDLVSVNYVADPECWRFLLQLPRVWRVMFPVRPETTDAEALSPEFGQALMARIVDGVCGYEIAHTTLYRVHQRVAKRFRAGRVFLAGDAAHINNPLGGMGMNGGIHDAMNLTARLGRVWRGEAGEQVLDGYDRSRRGVTMEQVQSQTIQNKRDLEAADPVDQATFRDRLRAIAADPAETRAYLTRLAMIDSLRRAEALEHAPCAKSNGDPR